MSQKLPLFFFQCAYAICDNKRLNLYRPQITIVFKEDLSKKQKRVPDTWQAPRLEAFAMPGIMEQAK